MHRLDQALQHLTPQPTAAAATTITTTTMSTAKKPLINTTQAWKKLEQHQQQTDKQHLRTLLKDEQRNSHLTAEYDNIYVDYSRQRVTPETLKLLVELAKEADVNGKIKAMASGEHINISEDRAVGHIALRAARDSTFNIDGKNVVPEVWQVLDKIKAFTNKVRSGEWKGATGKPLKTVIAIGIGGSYLGAQFVYEALASEPGAAQQAAGRKLNFLANVDPVAVHRAIQNVDPAETLVVIISKTFTTRETMLNAHTIRQWLVDHLGEDAISKHVVACSTNEKEYTKFGIAKENAFTFWDWVGGRYSVTSAVGVVPLALHYGFDQIERFLSGARSVDQNFLNTSDPLKNLPYILGLLGVWNNNFHSWRSRALICYSEAMNKLAPHIQQVDMESNGKWVTVDGQELDGVNSGEVNFGEPGTNSQHSFFQLIHQGNNIVPVDFVGFVESQRNVKLEQEGVSNHEELMNNFFAQPDALAEGKTEEQLEQEGVKDPILKKHRYMPGNKPSTVILLPRLTAYEVGQILALFEHRTAIEGFIWNIDSFDQWGVELGKKLATNVREAIVNARKSNSSDVKGFNSSTTHLLKRFLSNPKAHEGPSHFK